MRILLFLMCLALLFSGCSAPAAQTTVPTAVLPTQPPETAMTTLPTQTQAPDPAQLLLEQMSTEEKVGQLFLARCDSATALDDIRQYHLGGLVLFSQDFSQQTPDSFRQALASYQSAAGTPLLIAVDEEGGDVTRISRYPAFRESPFPSPRTAYSQGGLDQALANEEAKCDLLASLRINVNLGPVCDMATDPQAFMYRRSLGQDVQETVSYVYETVSIMRLKGIGSVLKHFPGYGNNPDTHTGIAVDSRSLEELQLGDLIPFAFGIAAGCDAVLVSHTIVEAFDTEFPASLSPAVHQYLREEMGFSGVILTDDLVMQAITDAYGPEEAAILAVLAGNDLLCSTEYAIQYTAVYNAVLDGRIPMDALNAAVARVLKWKMDLGLL